MGLENRTCEPPVHYVGPGCFHCRCGFVELAQRLARDCDAVMVRSCNPEDEDDVRERPTDSA